MLIERSFVEGFIYLGHYYWIVEDDKKKAFECYCKAVEINNDSNDLNAFNDDREEFVLSRFHIDEDFVQLIKVYGE